MKTERIYEDNGMIFRFEATVMRCSACGDGYALACLLREAEIECALLIQGEPATPDAAFYRPFSMAFRLSSTLSIWYLTRKTARLYCGQLCFSIFRSFSTVSLRRMCAAGSTTHS